LVIRSEHRIRERSHDSLIVNNPGHRLTGLSGFLGNLPNAQLLHVIQMLYLVPSHGFHESPPCAHLHLDGPTLRKLSPLVDLVLYQPLFIPIGHKGASALPPEPDLVLYHSVFVSRDHENQPQTRLQEGYLVLYHPRSRCFRGLPALTPLFHIGIAPLKVPWIVLTPPMLSHRFTLPLTRLSMTRLLSVSHSRIRYKKLPAKQTPLPQGRPPPAPN